MTDSQQAQVSDCGGVRKERLVSLGVKGCTLGGSLQPWGSDFTSRDLFSHWQNGATGTYGLDKTLHIKHESSRTCLVLDSGTGAGLGEDGADDNSDLTVKQPPCQPTWCQGLTHTISCHPKAQSTKPSAQSHT